MEQQKEPLDKHNFVTLHDLAVAMNEPEKNVRYLFNQLKKKGRLQETEDFYKADFVDDTHFTWRIKAVSFMKASDRDFSAASTSSSRTEEPTDDLPPVSDERAESPSSGSETATKDETSSSQPGTGSTNDSQANVLVGLLAEQLQKKDEQIEALTKSAERHDVMLEGAYQRQERLVSTNVALTERIHQLADGQTKGESKEDEPLEGERVGKEASATGGRYIPEDETPKTGKKEVETQPLDLPDVDLSSDRSE